MFTGIIEELGTIESIETNNTSSQITIACHKVLQDIKLGDSISTSGVCLTVVKYTAHSFVANMLPETIRDTSLIHLKKGDSVNLERAMQLKSRLGGHMVSGHVDTVGEVVAVTKEADALWYTIRLAKEHMLYIVNKGSIAVDGISLTVMSTKEDTFAVSLIPATQKDTTLSLKKRGDKINLEFDMIGKYVQHFLTHKHTEPINKISKDFLTKNGFTNG